MSKNEKVSTHSGYPNFLLAGTECECDLDVRCNNHDSEAESAYWRGRVHGIPHRIAYPHAA